MNLRFLRSAFSMSLSVIGSPFAARFIKSPILKLLSRSNSIAVLYSSAAWSLANSLCPSGPPMGQDLTEAWQGIMAGCPFLLLMWYLTIINSYESDSRRLQFC